MTKKTILHISKYYSPCEGGIETVAKYLADGLSEYDNIVVCYAAGGKTRMDTVDNVKVYRVAPFMRVSSQDLCLGYWKMMKELARQYKPDIALIHCPNPFVYPIAIHALPKSCKKVLLWHSDILDKGWLYKVIRPIETEALKKADLILATSPAYVSPASPIYKYRDKVRVLPNGVIVSNLRLREGDAEKIAAVRARYAPSKLVLFVGRHIPYKGIDCLIASERYIKSDVRILIAGEGPETGRLKKLAEGHGRIEFLGRVSNDDLRCLYHAADIFGFVSVTRQEAFGVAMAEAMYCGCVPVTFHIEGSGVDWVNINGVTGEEVPLKDVRAYAAAIDKIANDPQLMKRYSEHCRQRITEHFTDAKTVEMARSILKELLP